MATTSKAIESILSFHRFFIFLLLVFFQRTLSFFSHHINTKRRREKKEEFFMLFLCDVFRAEMERWEKDGEKQVTSKYRKKKLLLKANLSFVCMLCASHFSISLWFFFLLSFAFAWHLTTSHMKSGKAFTYWWWDARVDGWYWICLFIENIRRTVIPSIDTISQIVFRRCQCVVLEDRKGER